MDATYVIILLYILLSRCASKANASRQIDHRLIVLSILRLHFMIHFADLINYQSKFTPFELGYPPYSQQANAASPGTALLNDTMVAAVVSSGRYLSNHMAHGQ